LPLALNSNEYTAFRLCNLPGGALFFCLFCFVLLSLSALSVSVLPNGCRWTVGAKLIEGTLSIRYLVYILFVVSLHFVYQVKTKYK